jgi:hypothetical protein
MDRIAKSFRKLRDKPCWSVHRGHGTFLTFEFGAPHLEIREPIKPMWSTKPRARKWLQRRHVWVKGQWHLWIYCCSWEVREKGRVAGDWSTKRRIDRAAQFLDGRKLLSVEVRPRGSRTLFRFESDVEMETKPYDRVSEQWFLYEPNGRVLSFRADRKYKYEPGNRASNKAQWRRVL